ncbi:MAG: hypothetical protein JWN78_2224 [Bacteroidota bacterium]|nr:hypothetical protein [Bacteroidota bacterium]
MKKLSFLFLAFSTLMISCKTNTPVTPSGPKLIFKFKFDSTQVRLNNFGNPATMPAGHAGQSPKFNAMSAHYIELAPDSLTFLGGGNILYKAPETTAGGSNAIDFSKSINAGDGQEFFSVPISEVTPGTYKWLRVSLAYQNFDIKMKYVHPTYGTFYPGGTVAAFIGFNTYIQSFTVKNQSVAVNGNRAQGFGGAEVTSGIPVSPPPPFVWQAPAGATTVPNPIALTSPIPAGSCVVTGRFPVSLTITGTETHDIVITVSLSTNKSFEWKDKNGDGLYEPVDGADNVTVLDSVVDMGIRGLIPIVN